MAKQNPPTWYFVDFENTNSLGEINLKSSDLLILFCGHNQKSISTDLLEEITKSHCIFECCKANGLTKNNVDFHLVYYLGAYHQNATKGTKFVIVSNDSGYDNLIQRIKLQGVDCSRHKILNAV